MYPDDRIAPLMLTRASISPGSSATSGNAAELTRNAVADFLGNLIPLSAAAALMPNGLQLTLDDAGVNSVTVPARSGSPSAPVFVSELSPAPVRSGTTTGTTVGPTRKFGSMVVVSKTVLKRSGGERVFTTLLAEDASAGLDAAVFSTETGAGGAPAGLLYGATSVAGTSSLLSDLQALAASVSVNGSGQVVFIASPSLAASVGIDAAIRATVLPSLAVADTRLIAVDPASLIWGYGLDPEISASTDAVVHMDSDPDQIVESGITAVPTRSVFQTDAVAFRMLLPVAFAKRREGAVAVIDGGSWV
jgi:hypothetical protein